MTCHGCFNPVCGSSPCFCCCRQPSAPTKPSIHWRSVVLWPSSGGLLSLFFRKVLATVVHSFPLDMRATHRLLSRLSFRGDFPLPGDHKLLLPAPTFWDNIFNAVQGLWCVATSPKQREGFETAIQDKVIKDDVLKNAYSGATMTFALYWNLQSPLWKTKSTTFDAREFIGAVGPALSNLHDFLHSLENQIRQDYQEFQAEQKKSPDTAAEKDKAGEDNDVAKEETEEANIFSLLPLPPHLDQSFLKFLSKPYPWREQAEADPDSLAAGLSRMTSPAYLDGFVASAKLGVALSDMAHYEEGSARVDNVAILNARAMEIPLPGQVVDDTSEGWREEFRATAEANLKTGVAAQIDVLYEVTNRFRETVTTTQEDGGGDVGTQEEYVEYTSLGVAVFEGWLDMGGGNDSDGAHELRWKVPLMREPSEFPLIAPTLRRVLSTDANEKPTEQADQSDTVKAGKSTDGSSNRNT
jgi:hypothetical protein